MSSAAKFNRIISHIHDTDYITVFFSEQSPRSCLFCLFDRHIFNIYIVCFCNTFIDKFLNLCDLIFCHRRKMCKIKAKSVFIYAWSCLFYMTSQHCTKCFLKKMSCAMIPCWKSTLFRIHFQHYFISGSDHSLCHNSDMTDFSAEQFHCIFYFKFTFCSTDISCIRLLTSACRIKRGLLNKDRTVLSFR